MPDHYDNPPHHRRWLITGAVICVVIVAGYGGVWLYAANQIMNNIEYWAKSSRPP